MKPILVFTHLQWLGLGNVNLLLLCFIAGLPSLDTAVAALVRSVLMLLAFRSILVLVRRGNLIIYWLANKPITGAILLVGIFSL